MTQTQLAKRCSTAQSAISRIEQNRISPTVDTLDRLVAGTGMELYVAAMRRVPAVEATTRETGAEA